MFEIYYKAKFCDGPLNGLIETQKAVNGIMLDAIGKSYPGESGFEFARYVRDGFPDSEGVVRYNWDARETNHDAAPAAKGPTSGGAAPGVGGTASYAATGATGDTQEPVAWAVVYPNGAEAIICFRKDDAEDMASASDRVVPLYRQPQPALTEWERSVIQACVELSEKAGIAKAAATLRGLLERTK